MVAVFVALMFVSLMIVNLSVEKWRAAQPRAVVSAPPAVSSTSLVPGFGRETFCKLPQGVHLSPHHTWVKPYGAGGLEIGADALLAHVVGPAGLVVLPKAGAQVQAGQPLFRVEHNGRGMTIPSAVSGRVLAVNSRLHDHPELLNSDPYGAGWVCYLGQEWTEGQAASPSFTDKPAAWLESEFARLKEFIFMQVSPNLAVGVTSQDGGVPTIGCLNHLDQKAWTAFEAEFLWHG